MILAMDVGNTETVLGLFREDEVVAHWRVATVRQRTTDEYRLLVGGLLDLGGFDPAHDVQGVAVSSVVPAAAPALRVMAAQLQRGPVVVVEPGVRTGMPIVIDNPREVGADRVVNSIAALARYGGPVVVVDFGTSTNFDVVSSAGEYIGGAIAPGLEVSQDALVRATAALRRVELRPPRSAVGKGTVEAMQSGLVFGHAAMVDGLMDRILDDLGASAETVATGGLAPTIVPHCRTVKRVDDFLTLHGLRLVYELNVDV